jgi:hypothetical protein
MNRALFTCLFSIGALAACVASADPPATQPSTATADQVLSEYAADTDEQRSIAHVMANASVGATHLVKLARERWGADGEKAVALECLTDTRADDAAAHFSIDGDHATLTYDNQQLGKFYIVRRQGVWKIDVAAYQKEYGPDMFETVKFLQQSVQVYKSAANDLTAGKYSSAAELVADLDRQFKNL